MPGIQEPAHELFVAEFCPQVFSFSWQTWNLAPFHLDAVYWQVFWTLPGVPWVQCFVFEAGSPSVDQDWTPRASDSSEDLEDRYMEAVLEVPDEDSLLGDQQKVWMVDQEVQVVQDTHPDQGQSPDRVASTYLL